MYTFIREKLKNKDKILIGISGISLSGKTTVAKELQNNLESDNYKVQVISLVENENIVKDSFNYKNSSKYYYENAFNFNKVKEQVDECFKSNDIVIVEGLLLFKNTVKINFDVKVWIDCTFTTSINRAPMDKKTLCEDFYMWLHRQHFSIDNPKREVDIVIKNDDILEHEPEILVDFKNKPSSVKK